MSKQPTYGPKIATVRGTEVLDVVAACRGPHPEGWRPATHGDLCQAHDQQQRRHPRRALRPLRTLPGEGDKLTFRLTAELRERAAADAKRQGIDEGEWWRRAGRRALGLGVLALALWLPGCAMIKAAALSDCCCCDHHTHQRGSERPCDGTCR